VDSVPGFLLYIFGIYKRKSGDAKMSESQADKECARAQTLWRARDRELSKERLEWAPNLLC